MSTDLQALTEEVEKLLAEQKAKRIRKKLKRKNLEHSYKYLSMKKKIQK